MYSLPSTSQSFEPSARCVKNGVPPTPRNARTGEFTPPGSNRNASCQSLFELSTVRIYHFVFELHTAELLATRFGEQIENLFCRRRYLQATGPNVRDAVAVGIRVAGLRIVHE